jgi:hypothetical protein
LRRGASISAVCGGLVIRIHRSVIVSTPKSDFSSKKKARNKRASKKIFYFATKVSFYSAEQWR